MHNAISRYESNARMSRAVQFGDLVFVGGQTSDDDHVDIRTQTKHLLAKIDQYLEMAGTDKSRVLSAQIWLSDVSADFDAMNEVWEAWVARGCTPARATVEARLAAPMLRIEIAVVAAKSECSGQAT